MLGKKITTGLPVNEASIQTRCEIGETSALIFVFFYSRGIDICATYGIKDVLAVSKGLLQDNQRLCFECKTEEATASSYRAEYPLR